MKLESPNLKTGVLEEAEDFAWSCLRGRGLRGTDSEGGATTISLVAPKMEVKGWSFLGIGRWKFSVRGFQCQI